MRRDKQWQPTGESSGNTPSGSWAFPNCPSSSAFFFFCCLFKPWTPVPSAGRNLGAQPGSITSTWLFAINRYSGSINHQSHSRIVLYSQYILCCITKSPGWLDQLVHGLHGVKCSSPSSVQPCCAQPRLETGSWQCRALCAGHNSKSLLHIILLKWFEAHVSERGEKGLLSFPGISSGTFPLLYSKELVFVNQLLRRLVCRDQGWPCSGAPGLWWAACKPEHETCLLASFISPEFALQAGPWIFLCDCTLKKWTFFSIFFMMWGASVFTLNLVLLLAVPTHFWLKSQTWFGT